MHLRVEATYGEHLTPAEVYVRADQGDDDVELWIRSATGRTLARVLIDRRELADQLAGLVVAFVAVGPDAIVAEPATPRSRRVEQVARAIGDMHRESRA